MKNKLIFNLFNIFLKYPHDVYYKAVTNLECTVVTVTLHVPPTVGTIPVTYKMGPVIHVNPDGRENCVKQVRRTLYINFN